MSIAHKSVVSLTKSIDSHVIRIAPNELHLSDSDLYKTIYSQDGRYLKESNFYKTFANDLGIFGTTHTDLHKVLRHKMVPAFSKGEMLKAESVITSSIADLAAKLETRGYTRPVDLHSFCRCLPPDVVCKFAFGQSDVIAKCDDDFRTPILEAFDAASAGTWFRAYYPSMRWLQDRMHVDLVARVLTTVQKLKAFQDYAFHGVKDFRAGAKMGTELLPALSTVADLPDEVVRNGAISFIGGGSDTAGYTLSYALWHVLNDPELHERLLVELDPIFDAAAPEMPAMASLESAPLLSAIVKESLRCGPALPGRLPRIVPENAKTPLVVDGQFVPPGTIVGMSPFTMHKDPQLWGPDAAEFRPERWLEPQGPAKFSNIVVFGKGARDCIGRPLAMAEIHAGLAWLVHSYTFELMEGSHKWGSHDRFTALATEPFNAKMAKRSSGQGVL
jgi:cytochrome P450